MKKNIALIVMFVYAISFFSVLRIYYRQYNIEIGTAQTEMNTETTNIELNTKETTTEEVTIQRETTLPETTTQNTMDLGSFYITVYVPDEKWGYRTATGVTSKHLQTCAVDPSVIMLGTMLRVGGIEMKAVDTGSAVKGKHIDIFYDGSEKEAMSWLNNFGTSANVQIVGR